jgi:hypothetical protein
MKHKIRLEMKLFNISTDWLHIDNFKGTYRKIFNRYFDFLAILYKKFLKDYIIINSSENRFLDKIVKRSAMIDKVRFTNRHNRLLKQVPIENSKTSLATIVNSEKETAIFELKTLFDKFSLTINNSNEYNNFKEILFNQDNEKYLDIK